MLNRFTLLLLVLLLPMSAYANDEIVLKELLTEFLASTEQFDMHNRFWAEELIYTSSGGQRITKQVILADLKKTVEHSNDQPSYHAENIDIRLLGDTAIVAFKLIANVNNGESSGMQEYFNTGTFIKRNKQWQAIAWQATKIPQKS